MNENKSVKLNQKLLHIPFDEYEITNYSIFPGIELLFYRFLGSKIFSRHEALDHVIELNYCHEGSMGWYMNNDKTLFLDSGDLSIHTMSRCANSELTFPLQYYDGINITIDINKISTALPEILKDAKISGQNLYKKFCTFQDPVSIHNNNKIKQIFNDLYNSPDDMKTAYYKLKVQELIIVLSFLDISKEKIINPYYEQQVKLIHEIHSLLTQNLDHHFTIEALSKKYFINTSTLKETFKAVFGSPIASYMKEYRMKKAMELLRTTNYHISEIANNVGYQSQSKFTAAFKNISNILPSEYRKLNR